MKNGESLQLLTVKEIEFMQKLLLSICITLSFFSLSTSTFAQCSGNCGVTAVGNCGCDVDCWLYGDCCPDVAATCPDARSAISAFPSNSGNVNPLACNTNTSICSNSAGPFTFTSPGPGVSTCLDWIGPNVGYIILYITQSGPLQMLINGNASSGFLDVAVFNIPAGQNPCTAIQSTSNQIGCNYASSSNGCNQFGTYYPCSSTVPSPNVTAGQTVMIVVENWSGTSNNFTLSLSPNGAQSGPPNTTINVPPAGLCSNSSPVTLTAVNNGGTWSGPGTSSTGVFNPATAGVGTHTITYSLGVAPCNSSSTAQITVLPPPTTSFSSNSPICVGQTIELAAAPTPGATYHWSGPGNWTATGTNPTRPNATTAMSGTYSLYITTGGCNSTTFTQTVTVNPTGPAPTINSNSPVCYGNPVLFDGPSDASFQYFWSGPNGWTSNVEDPSFPTSDYSMNGNYSLYVISALGCTSAVSTMPLQISVPPKPVIANLPPQCFGASGSMLSADLPGGTWTGTAVSPNGLFDPSAAGSGIHQVIYTIPMPCGSADTSEVIVSYPISIQGIVKNETCAGVGDGAINITPNNVQSGSVLTYMWSNNATTEDIDSITFGNYSVVVTDQYGCSYDTSYVVSAGNSLNFTYSTNHVLCYGDKTGNIVIIPSSGTPPYLYTVNGIQNTSSPISNLPAGVYDIKITDSRGCDTSFVTQVNQPPALWADSTIHHIRLGDYTTFQPQTAGGTGVLLLSWLPNYNLSCTDCLTPMAWPEQSTNYTLTVTDANGCMVKGKVLVDVYHDGPFIPSSFTPGKDDLNNEWKVIDSGVKTFELMIFDRWGEKIFYSDNIYKGWDGKLKSGNYLESSVYVYKVRITYIDGKEKTVFGNITLLR